MKPCELPCPKCGSPDASRLFVGNGDPVKTEAYGKAPGKYVSGSGYEYTATRDHIRHQCQVCGYNWQTPPMKRAKAAKA